jgi:mono/diheme cytochrome c family protein
MGTAFHPRRGNVMQGTVRAAICAVLLCAPAPADRASAQDEDAKLAARGKALLSEQCSKCHQVEASGASPLAIAPPFHELMKRYAPEDLEEALGEGLSSGHPAMPEFTFEPEEIAAIVTFLGTFRKGR